MESPNPELLNRQPKWFKPVFYGCIVASILSILAGLSSPMVIRSRRASPQIEATRNARQIGLALNEFDTGWGTYPSASTVLLVLESDTLHSSDLTGKSSNVLFRQIIADNINQSEQMFYAKIPGVIRPDGIITPGEALKKHEVGFSYISGLSSNDNPLTPIVLTPLIPGTTKFDPKPFKGKAIILHIDGHVSSYVIHKDGHIYDKGIHILSPKHPIWNGKAPDIRYPE